MLGSVNFDETIEIMQSRTESKFGEFTFHQNVGGLDICCEGILLNAGKIAYQGETLAETIARLYRQGTDVLLNAFEGQFAIAIADTEKKDSCLVFNDRLSKQYIFYYIADGKTAFSTSFFELVSFLKKHGVSLTPDLIGASMIKYDNV